MERAEAIKQAVKYCCDNDILKEFLEKNSEKVCDMLLNELNMEDALDARFKEGVEEGLKQAARNALAEGFSIEVVQKINGLDVGTIAQLQPKA